VSHLNRQPSSRIIVALDFDDEQQALSLVEQLDPTRCRLKVGKEMFTYFGPAFVKRLIALNFDVFLDLKFHDIPNTVAKACCAAADLGVWMVNVHASGGEKMMIKAREVLDAFGAQRPLLTGVTVLTSMSEVELHQLGVSRSLNEQVSALAHLAKNCGLDGVVCSAQEAKSLKQALGNDFKLVTPGIRPLNAAKDDQTRIVTPEQAIQLGSDYLVIGRPITQSSDPLKTLCEISDSIQPLLKPE
jgi:orotidine-5'-phosphate decarboxylase